MDREDRSLEDFDGSTPSFRGATLRIHQEDNPTADSLATLPDSQPNNAGIWPKFLSVGRETNNLSPSEVESVSGTSRMDVAAMPCPEDHLRNLFASREGLVDQAVNDSTEAFVNFELDGDILGRYILTEINIWDAEKERLVLLTTNSLLVIKFDFIALKPLEVRRTPLLQIDTIVVGELVYPPASLVPARDMQGLRIMWNNGEPIAFSKKWNPFNNDIPFLTFASHPLLSHQDASSKEGDNQNPNMFVSYDVEKLSQQLLTAMENLQKSTKCLVQHKPILLHNYLSIGSLIHNRNSLGFFKVRGRFSF
ncbi:tumor protein p63-regulated gene 1-like protein isoform X2 [Frankliniella occidentalis]|uniref:Tumor protein p63-regulated gene 1-like protein isoform X2 n=1 Tax=Frankliniella occidentalis TaxID=133901 RepID=A0A6J1SBS3_FRAOC|nr:tumor protein p63-regulated gene 1-like protein isoform X2 [Frankliniella occidentalis]